MRKTFCDACGKEIEGNNLTKFEYPCHIESLTVNGYADSEGNRVSQRMVIKDLCNRCTNAVYSVAYEKFKSIGEIK